MDEAGAWRQAGHRSAAEHLARRGGVSIGAARSQLATSKRLAKCPQVETALRRGELSAPQADAVADAAEVDPAAERRLVDLAAKTSVAELRIECARIKAAADPDPEGRERRHHRGRSFRQGTGPDGSWWFGGGGTVAAGAGFNTVLEPIVDELFDKAREQGERPTREQLAFDALMELARRCWDAPETDENDDVQGNDNPERGSDGSFDAAAAADGDGLFGESVDDASTGESPDTGDAAGSAGGDVDAGGSLPPDPAPDGFGPQHPRSVADVPDDDRRQGTSPSASTAGRSGRRRKQRKRRRRSRSNPRYLAVIRADLDALVRGHVEGDETCEIAGFGPVSVAAARDLLGDAVLRLVLTRGNDVVNTTYLGRGPSAAQKVALLWSSPTCVVTGCVARRVQHDHRRPWADRQETRLDNIDDYCAHHHQLKTLHNWALVTDSDRREMVPPTDPRHPDNTKPDPWRLAPQPTQPPGSAWLFGRRLTGTDTSPGTGPRCTHTFGDRNGLNAP